MKRKIISIPKDSIAKISKNLWKGFGSSHFGNLIGLASLVVTIYLTLFIFDYTNSQELSSVRVSIDVVPTRISDFGQRWNVTVSLQNSGPADIEESNFFITLQKSPQINLVEFGYKDFVGIVNDPYWGRSLPTPPPSDFGDYVIALRDFEKGDSMNIMMVFDVESGLSDTINEQWDALSIKKITDIDGGHYYDFSQVDKEKYALLISNFVKGFSMSGQNVSLTGIILGKDLSSSQP
ncbi:MAG: hypothetical protein IPP66_17700 [Anaerolineales bacterium]|nr:hypothetical protein [Anaerolineales bacterium]